MPRDLEMISERDIKPEIDIKSHDNYDEGQEDLFIIPTQKVEPWKREIKENPRDPNPNFTQNEEIKCTEEVESGEKAKYMQRPNQGT